MSAKLNNCMTKVVQLEETFDLSDDENKLVEGLKSNLEELNNEKDILIKYIQQQSPKAAQKGLAQV